MHCVYSVDEPAQIKVVREVKGMKHELMQRRKRHGGRSMNGETKLRCELREKALVDNIHTKLKGLPDGTRKLLSKNVDLEEFIRSASDEKENYPSPRRTGIIRPSDRQDSLFPGVSL